MLPEFDHEMATTRRVLERCPDGKFDYKPHTKSFALGRLAAHITNIPTWVGLMLGADHLDIDPPGGNNWQIPEPETAAELVAVFDQNVTAARAALEGATDAQMMGSWSLLKAGQPIFTQPRIGVIRGMVMNHMVHHRGQLSVYFRLNDVPVPSIYGPSADESGF